MLQDCVLERGMAEGEAVDVEGRVNASTRIVMWLKGSIVDVGLDAASVDALCMVLVPPLRHAAARRRPDHPRGPCQAQPPVRGARYVMSGQSSADSSPPRTMAQLMLARKKVG